MSGKLGQGERQCHTIVLNVAGADRGSDWVVSG